MGSQGFRNIAGNPFVYQEDTRSAAFGLDAAAQTWKIAVLNTTGALPTSTAQIIIDPATNGNVTIDPNGSGNLVLTSGSLSVTSGNVLLPTTSSTVGQITQNSQTLFHTFTPVASIAELNMFVGKASGNFTLGTGTFGCVALGPNTLTALTSNAKGNSAFGADTLFGVTSGKLNIGFGIGSGYAITTGIQNTLIGSYVAQGLIGGNYNVAIGLGNTTWETGSFNGAGQAWTGSESNNILINNAGVAGESNAMRIGTTGSGNAQVNKCYIAATYGVTPGGTINIALVDSNGQLGSTATLAQSY